MNAQDTTYRKLPGQGYRTTGSPALRIALFFVIGFFVLLLRGKKVRLWLGDDHLLVVDSDGYTEDYKRFYLKDIQGITIRRTVEGKFINFVLVLPTILFLVLAASNRDMAPGLFFVAAVFGFFLIINVVRGATCEAQLFTAIQSEKLVSLNRLKTAQKVLHTLEPLIMAAQGELKPEEMQAAVPEGEKPDNSTALPSIVIEPEVPYRSKVHLILSGVALADVLGTALVTWLGSELSRLYALVHIAAIVILAIIAINKQRNTTLPRGLKRLPMVLLVNVIGCSVISGVLAFYYAITYPEAASSMVEDPMSAPWQLVMTLLSTGVNGLAGLYGVINFRRYQQGLQAVVPPPVNTATPPLSPDLPV